MHMRNLLNCSPVANKSVNQLLRLSDATNESNRAFKNMNSPTDEWEDWFVSLPVFTLDLITCEDWKKSLMNSMESPVIKELLSLIETRIRALEATPVTETTSNKQGPDKKSCYMCQSTYFVSYCPPLKEFPPTSHHTFVHGRLSENS